LETLFPLIILCEASGDIPKERVQADVLDALFLGNLEDGQESES